jgi:recombination protein RecT
MSNNSLRTAAQQPSKPPAKSFAGMLEEMKPQLQAALPKHLNAERMMRVALTCFRQTPELAKCSPQSVMAAVVQCAQLGLEPGLLGQAYLIPFKKNTKDKETNTWRTTMECQFIPGYKGLISLARRSGDVTSITATTVRKGDKFKLSLGIDPTIDHEPLMSGDDRGPIVLVYAVAKFKDGGYHFEWMTKAEIDAIRARSKASAAGPWVTDYEQMAKKTVIRRMANYLPMSVEFANAITASDAVDDGKGIVIDGGFVEYTEDEPAGDEEGGDATPAVTQQTNQQLDPASRTQQRDPVPRETGSAQPNNARTQQQPASDDGFTANME